ncbi:MAG: hypothetical protein LBC53_09685 [Spirochaetaceae bacterium]|nr:hypothetical protein [Spirochaetaceae bacterium]
MKAKKQKNQNETGRRIKKQFLKIKGIPPPPRRTSVCVFELQPIFFYNRYLTRMFSSRSIFSMNISSIIFNVSSALFTFKNDVISPAQSFLFLAACFGAAF